MGSGHATCWTGPPQSVGPAMDLGHSLRVSQNLSQSQSWLWHNFCLRREALLVRVEVKDLHQPAVAAVGLKLRAA